ncbi:MAG: hypothetical protein ACHQE6_05730 [Solirubrobacterales bacterium]
MRFSVYTTVRPARICLIALLVAAGFVTIAASVAQASSFGVEKFVAANCTGPFEECGSVTTSIGPFKYSTPKEPTLAEAKEQAYTQAAGHPAWGITDFKVNTEGTLPNEVPVGIAEGKVVTHVRTDVGPGVSTNPEAVAKCSFAQFGEKEAIPGTGFYSEPTCSPESEIGVNRVTVYVGSEPFPKGGDVAIEGKVYNLVQPAGLASDFGVALELPKPLTKGALEKAFAEHPLPGTEPEKKLTEEFLEAQQYYAHTLIEGSVEWAGDYHDYYEINVSPRLPLIASRLVLKGEIGTTGQGGFITNPSNCAGPGAATLNTVTLTSTTGQKEAREYEAPLGTEGCNGAAPFSAVPFAPAFTLIPETAQSDQPDGITTELTLPHDSSPKGIDSSQLKNASITLPEGMTLNPSAAHGLEACTPAQIGIGTRNPVTCPAGSKIGTVTLVVPDLPASEPLQGNLYLGGPESGPITGPPYTMYIDAESARYGLSVRLKGAAVPNEATGRLTASFIENPQQPFSDLTLHFNGGALAPLANPLACGTATTETSFEPYIGSFATESHSKSFLVDSNNAKGACPAPLPFALTQGTANQSSVAGAHTSYTFSLARTDGQQYLSQVKTVLPAGLVGPIPSVTLCGEAQANAGNCTAASQIGNAAVSAGAGAAPFLFTGGVVYLTGPYNGAPYGLSIVVPAVAGPFNLGNVVTRAAINVEPYTGRVVVTSTLPTIVRGVPLRIRSVTVAVNRQNFLTNPTNCGALATESTLTGFVPGSSATATQSLSSPFQVGECNKLAFKPTLTAFTGAKTSKANGASIEVKISQGSGEANLQKVITTLPKQLPVRQSTLTKACPQATFEVANYPPGACPDTARVGGATATTPILPGKLEGPAYLVSHGGAAFPDLDLILRGDGVVVILVGHTHVSKGIITTTFESLPDVPVTSFAVKLPTRSNSLLAANGNLCTSNLTMPTTIMAQSGTKITQKTKISVTNCPVQIVGHRTSGATAKMTVQAPAAGRISGSGTDLQFVTRHLSKAGRATINVPLTRTGREVLGKFRTLRIKVRVGFVPKKGNKTSKAYATVTFRA